MRGVGVPMAKQADDNFFKDLCLNAGVALIATDGDLRIRFWNPMASRLFGGSPESMVGQSISSIVPSDRRELATRLLERAIHKGEINEFEFHHRDPTGRPVYLAVTVSPIIDQDDGAPGASVCVRDVTRRMELEREMASTQKMSALGSMAGAVAHHFNNFLGGIITSIDFARHSDDPEVLRRALRTTASSLSRASDLTLRLLAFAEGAPADSDARDVAEVVEQFVTDVRPTLETHGCRVEAEIEPVHLALPARKILTILECITDNAREAMSDGGTVRFALRPAGGGREVLLCVGDTGIGVSEEDRPHVFEPFFTSKRGTTAAGVEHAGLGLAVVHGIVRDLGGHVSLTCPPEGGTVCTIRLPRPDHAGQPSQT